MRSVTARESTRHTARSAVAPGKWDQTIYHHTHPPPPKANPAHSETPHAGDPAAGAGSRCSNCGPGGSCADDDGSATVGDGDGCGGSGDGCGGSGSADTRVGVGCGFGGVGTPGCSLHPGLTGTEADTLASGDGETEGDADPPRSPFPRPFLPSPTATPTPAPPPDTAGPPPGGTPPRCPTECDGFTLPPASPSPTLIQPEAAATAMTVTARRTGTYKGRTGHLRG